MQIARGAACIYTFDWRVVWLRIESVTVLTRLLHTLQEARGLPARFI